jgi:uncharacterized protein with HEPN domain
MVTAATSISWSMRYRAPPCSVWVVMRNRVAHGYFEINLDLVWDTVRTALPELLVKLANLAAIGDYSTASKP